MSALLPGQPKDCHTGSEQQQSVAPMAAAIRQALDAGDALTAQRVAQELLDAFPGDRQGFFLKARALVAQRQLAGAMDTLREALSIHNGDAKLLSYTRNIALEHLGRDAAAEYALKLSEIASGDLKNQLFLVSWHLASGRADAALALVEVLSDAHPSSAQVVMMKAQILLDLGLADRALRLLRERLSEHRDNAKFLTLIRNVAFSEGKIAEAMDYAKIASEISPDDQKNRVFLVQCCLASGEFHDALSTADALVEAFPSDVPSIMLRAQALVALHRVREALRILEDVAAAEPQNRRLARMLRSVAYHNGYFDAAVRHALRVSELEPHDERNQALLIHAYVAAGRLDEVANYFRSMDQLPAPGVLGKEYHYLQTYEQLSESAPAFIAAWQLALANSVKQRAAVSANESNLGATMIQYWSQGAPPADVQIVCDNWRALFLEEKLGKVEHFDRTSADAWISENAPEFQEAFRKAFHYAMESDIFRIAYASQRPCIYMDIDSWPLEHTSAILRFAVRNNVTMLYLRAHRACIANGFFVSTPENPFIQELVRQCLGIDVDSLPKDYVALESSFGPSRYTKVLLDLLASHGRAVASKVDEIAGCSVVTFGTDRVYLTHDAAVASVRPPFPLGYKATDDYWKFISLPNVA